MKRSKGIVVKTPEQLAGCRRAGQAAADVLRIVCGAVRPGMTTKELDDFAARTMADLGCRSADFGYCGYPAQTCISVNEAVIHGVPRESVTIREGDVVSVDITVECGGFVGDNARTVIVGEAPPEVRALVETTEKALAAGIAMARAGNRVGDISHAVEVVANAARLGIVHEYVGHGCGLDMHEEPEIPNWGPSHRGPPLQAGMVLCIEPMLTLGSRRIRVLEDDGWTVVTCDGKPAAHAEQMIAVTDGAPEILTPR
ncbi:MAG: type I methionyl aminopeptidase [Kiritimatiellae bacterium]|nr:type I methionyl aminopeptidase [Kiritimatiellia bacterium]